MNPWQKDVKQLHLKFGHPAPDRFTLLTPELREFRARLILEEAKETAEALTGRTYKITSTDPDFRLIDPLDAIDGGCDTIVVSLGMIVAMGLDLGPFMAEVQRANMAKEPNGPGKFIKPHGWKPPDIRGELRKQQALLPGEWRCRCQIVAGFASAGFDYGLNTSSVDSCQRCGDRRPT